MQFTLRQTYRALFPALILALQPIAASASSFALPVGSTVNVREFTFPETVPETLGLNLPALLRDRLADSLGKAGFAVRLERPEKEAPVPAFPAAPEAGSASPYLDTPSILAGEGAAALSVTPLKEHGQEGENALKQGASEPVSPGTAAKNGAAEQIAGPSAAQTKKTKVPSQPLPDETAPVSAQPGTAPGESAMESPQYFLTGPENVQGANPPEKAAQALSESGPVYTLTGRVTLLRENIGSPTRIGGGIRIRAEAILHCAYRVEDASGNVIIAATASDSAARLVANPQNIDTALVSLLNSVMGATADQIAARLAGMERVAPEKQNDASYYQDSPGKRLRK